MSGRRDVEALIRAEKTLRDREAHRYDSERSEWEQRVQDACVDALLDLRPEHMLLDVGAGTGRRLPEFLRRARRVIAADHSAASLAIARERTPAESHARLEAIVTDVRSLPLEDHSVDRAVSLSVVQHIPQHAQRLRAVREIHRVLKPGGVLVALVYRWLGRVRRHKEGFWSPELYRYAFTIPEFAALLREAGFVRIETASPVVLPAIAEPLGMSPAAQRRLAFSRLGRTLGHYVVARGVRPD